MATDRNLRHLVSKRLIASGFRRTGRNHLKLLQPGVWSVVDTGPLENRSDIAPWVGLRLDEVEEAYTRLLGIPNEGHIATVGSNVGYIVSGEYKHWTGEADAEDVLAEIERAQRVLSSYADIERLSEAWKIRGTEAPGYQRHLALVHHMVGNRAETQRWLREAERVDCRVEDALCDEFRRFREKLVAESSSPR